MNSIKFIRLTTLIICAVCAAVFTACSDDDETPSIKFNPSSLSVVVDSTQMVRMAGGDGTYTAKSSDENTATVTVVKDSLFVKGIKAGKATIVVTDSKNVAGSLSVSVFDSLKVAKTQMSLATGKDETVAISGGTAPYTATSKNAKIATATIKDAQLTIKGVAEGSTSITVTDQNKMTVTVAVTVTK